MSWTTFERVSAALPVTEARRPTSSSDQDVGEGGSGAGWLTTGSPSRTVLCCGRDGNRPPDPKRAFSRGFGRVEHAILPSAQPFLGSTFVLDSPNPGDRIVHRGTGRIDEHRET